MREFIKGVYVTTILVGVIAIPFAWAEDRPGGITWMFRIGAPLVTLAAFMAFWRMHFRKDEVPDYLSQLGLPFFDRGGFCFAFVSRVDEGFCFLDVYFQNRFEKPCRGHIALQPARGFFGRRKIDIIAFDIACPAAGFGVVSVCVPVPATVQGRRQKFEVGASVEYEHGRGKMLRFRDGIAIRADSDFSDVFGSAVTVAGALVGTFVLSSPATVTLSLPNDVAEELPHEVPPVSRTLWQLGDSPLEPLNSG